MISILKLWFWMILHSSSISDSLSFTSISFSQFNQYQFRILIHLDHTNNEFKHSNHHFFTLFQLISLSFIFTHIIFTDHCSFHSSIDYPQIRYIRFLEVSLIIMIFGSIISLSSFHWLCLVMWRTLLLVIHHHFGSN